MLGGRGIDPPPEALELPISQEGDPPSGRPSLSISHQGPPSPITSQYALSSYRCHGRRHVAAACSYRLGVERFVELVMSSEAPTKKKSAKVAPAKAADKPDRPVIIEKPANSNNLQAATSTGVKLTRWGRKTKQNDPASEQSASKLPLAKRLSFQRRAKIGVSGIKFKAPSAASVFTVISKPVRRKKAKPRLIGTIAAAVLLAVCGFLLLMLCATQVAHYVGVHTGSWLSVLREGIDYSELWTSLVRTPSADPPVWYLPAAAILGVFFGVGPAILTLLYWLWLLTAQACRARSNNKAGANWKSAFLDTAKGG